MVKVVFKLSEIGSVNLEITEPISLDLVLRKCVEITGIDVGGVIAVRDGRVINAETTISENDTIEVFPAISGG